MLIGVRLFPHGHSVAPSTKAILTAGRQSFHWYAHNRYFTLDCLLIYFASQGFLMGVAGSAFCIKLEDMGFDFNRDWAGEYIQNVWVSQFLPPGWTENMIGRFRSELANARGLHFVKPPTLNNFVKGLGKGRDEETFALCDGALSVRLILFIYTFLTFDFSATSPLTRSFDRTAELTLSSWWIPPRT